MEDNLKEAKLTAKEMGAGILIMSALFLAIGIWIAGNKLSYVLGILLGMSIAIAVLWHMYKGLDEALDLDEHMAVKYMRKKSIIRLVMMGLAVGAACMLPDIFNPFAVVIGVLALKFAAYIQPLVHKYIFKKKENE